MNIESYFGKARDKANLIKDWSSNSFSWEKCFVASVFAAIAYEEIPVFELKKAKRTKLIPCERYQVHIASWNETQKKASISNLDLGGSDTEVIIRNHVVITITKLTNVIFVALRGTTLSFSDFKADLDCRKIKHPFGGATVKIHKGFYNAVLQCYDETIARLNAINENNIPIYVTGHSLGGAMATIFHARMIQDSNFPFLYSSQSRSKIPSTACYSFGMPRVGNSNTNIFLAQPYHVYNEFDAIPTLPPTFIGFSDSVNERCVSALPAVIQVEKKGNFGIRKGKGIVSILGVSDHRMERYVRRMEQLDSAGSKTLPE